MVLGKSIVLKDVVAGGVVSGIPAKFKKMRDEWRDDDDDDDDDGGGGGDDLLWWGGYWMTEAGITTREEEEQYISAVKRAFEPLLTNEGRGTDSCK